MDTYVNYAARDEAHSLPLDKIDVSDPQLYQDDTYYPYFERLRREAPVHWCRESRYGLAICVGLNYTYVELIYRYAYLSRPKICRHAGGNSSAFSANSGSSGTSRTPAKMSALVVWAISGSLEGLFKTTPAQRKPAT